jgi:acyl-CoA thioester hydrolase
MSAEPFRVRLDVRVYELDPQRHVGGSVYLQYADQARFACMQAAGVAVDELLAGGVGPVNLETTIRYARELRLGDAVEVSCGWVWHEGKTYGVEHVLRRSDGEPVAEIRHVSGLLDLEARRLLPDPAGVLRSRASRPALLGLP